MVSALILVGLLCVACGRGDEHAHEDAHGHVYGPTDGHADSHGGGYGDRHAAGLKDPLGRPALSSDLASRAVLLDIVRAGRRLVAIGERGIIILSDDDGDTWRQARVPVSVSLTAVTFASAQLGWAVGHGGIILRTEDGGEQWRLQLDGRKVAAAIAATKGVDAAEAQRWQREGADKPFLAVRTDASGAVWAVGAYGMAFRSEDGGAHWDYFGAKLANPRGNHLYAIAMRGKSVFIAGEQGALFRSADAGATFARTELPYKGSFFELLPTPKGVFVSGMGGKLFHTADDGRTWQLVPNPMPSTLLKGIASADGRVLWLNQAGAFLSGTDSADALNPTGLAPSAGGVRFLPVGKDRYVAVGFRGVQKPAAAAEH